MSCPPPTREVLLLKKEHLNHYTAVIHYSDALRRCATAMRYTTDSVLKETGEARRSGLVVKI